jgi:hypothetical protein
MDWFRIRNRDHNDYMNPLIDNFTNILKPCRGCGTNLGSSEFDIFWKPKEEHAVDDDPIKKSESKDTEVHPN